MRAMDLRMGVGGLVGRGVTGGTARATLLAVWGEGAHARARR